MRFRSELLVALTVLASGCAFEDGEPWARANFEAKVAFDEAGRLQDGRLRTAKNYAVELDSIVVELAAMSIVAGAASGVDFDPANPPAGYSLCHNGHCHSDDGRLVDYDDIAIELGGVSGVEVTSTLTRTVSVADEPSTVTASECEGSCELPRGAVTNSRIVLRGFTVSGRAFDTLQQSRIPEEGVPFEITLADEERFEAPVTGFVGEGLEGELNVEGDLTLPAQILDEIDFQNLDGAVEALRFGLVEESSWTTLINNKGEKE